MEEQDETIKSTFRVRVRDISAVFNAIDRKIHGRLRFRPGLARGAEDSNGWLICHWFKLFKMFKSFKTIRDIPNASNGWNPLNDWNLYNDVLFLW